MKLHLIPNTVASPPISLTLKGGATQTKTACAVYKDKDKDKGGNLTKFCITTAAALLGLSLTLLASKEACALTFTKIADTSGSFREFFEAPSINDSGTVAFRAQKDFFAGIFTSNGGDVVNTIVRNDIDTEIVLGLKNNPAINNGGRVAFEATTSTTIGEGVFIRSLGEPITTISIIGSSFKGDPAINDNGTVAVTASAYPGGEALIIGRGEARPTVIRTGSPLFSSFGESTSINNQETVAFSAILDSASFLLGLTPGNQGIFTTSDRGNSYNVILDTSGSFNNFGDLVLNDSDATAFIADLDTGGQGIFQINTKPAPGLFGSIIPSPTNLPTYVPGLDIGGTSLFNNGLIKTIVDNSGAFSSFDTLSFNNRGTTAFFATLDTGIQGIFSGSGPVANKIIAIGDTFLGSTVTKLSFSQTGLNNVGQIAFFAELADGTKGIFVANPDSSPEPPPKAIPEPNSLLGLLAFGLFSFTSRLKRQRRR
jgi:hypothetical protein